MLLTPYLRTTRSHNFGLPIRTPSACEHVPEHVLPFDLDVIHTRVKHWAGDAHGHIDMLGVLLCQCRRCAQSACLRRESPDMDRAQCARVGLITPCAARASCNSTTKTVIYKGNQRPAAPMPSCAPCSAECTSNSDRSTRPKGTSRPWRQT